MVNVTTLAAEKISELLADEQKPGAGLRVFVQGGGCSGFQYGLIIVENGATPDADTVFQSNGVTLYVDPISARYLKGAEVDFIWTRGGRSVGIEVKATQRWRPEDGRALEDLSAAGVLRRMVAVYLGRTPLKSGGVDVLPLARFLADLRAGSIIG